MHLHQGLDYEVPDDMYQSFRSEKPDRNMVLKYTLNKLFFCIDKRAQYKQPPLLLHKLNLIPYPVQLAEINTERKVQQ